VVIGRSEEEGGHLYVRERTAVVVVELELPAVHCDVCEHKYVRGVNLEVVNS